MSLVTQAFRHTDGEPQAPVQDDWQVAVDGHHVLNGRDRTV